MAQAQAHGHRLPPSRVADSLSRRRFADRYRPILKSSCRSATMKLIRFVPVSLLFAALCATMSLAQQRTFVSGSGSDANACSRTAPCRTFTQALSQTSAGGEVVVLDSAGY